LIASPKSSFLIALSIGKVSLYELVRLKYNFQLVEKA